MSEVSDVFFWKISRTPRVRARYKDFTKRTNDDDFMMDDGR